MRILQCCAGGLWAKPMTHELRRLGHEVVYGDCDPKAAAWDGEFVKLPRAEKDRDGFLAAAVGANCGMAIPHTHAEAVALAGCEGFAVVPPLVSLRLTHDKKSFCDACVEVSPVRVRYGVVWHSVGKNPIDIPEEVEIIAKPRIGAGSAGVMRSTAPEEFLVMEKMKGPEYTVDLVAWNSSLVTYCVRERIKAHGGVCVHARVRGGEVPGCDIRQYLMAFCRCFGWHGPAALQFFLVESDVHGPAPFFTDCNARFGGGVAFSIMAGWGGVESLISCHLGERPVPQDAMPGEYRRWYVEEEINAVEQGEA